MKRYIKTNKGFTADKYRAIPKSSKGAVWLVDKSVFKHISDYSHQIPAVSLDGKFETIIDDRLYDFYK